jgi:RHS repeat-associated protein
VTKASKTITSTVGTWYDYHIITEGNRMEVWRGPQGGTTELLLETDAATVLGSAAMVLETRLCTASFDNVQYITNDPATQTMAYNGANELTSSVVGAITTTYTYDEWGRTISKADGTHTATYYWRFGDKLKQYDTTFPGESSVAFQYDGLGKRRLKLQLPSGGYTDADFTWYRWDAGWNMIGEYAAGGNTGTEWDVGALGRWYQGKVAHADGEPDIAAHNYYSHDQLGTPRSIYSQSKVVVARQETSPYGVPIRIAGLAMDVGFTGHKWDSEIKGYYAAYRYYHPTEARWISRDPLGMVDGPNTYVYVNCGPISSKDDLGLFGGPISPPGTNPWGPGGPYQNAANASDCESCAEAARRLREAGYNEYPFEPTDSNNFMRHCTTSCQLAREKGKACAFAAGWAGEFRGHFSWDDARINSIGRRVSDSALSCKAGCKAARNGML